MRSEKKPKTVLAGKRYNLSTATLLASNKYWDGKSYSTSGIYTYLYRTRRGDYFKFTLSENPGESEKFTPLTKSEAIDLYWSLPTHEEDYEPAFEDAPGDPLAGRTPLYEKPMKQTAIYLTDEMLAWAKHKGNISKTIRDLIEKEMNREKE